MTLAKELKELLKTAKIENAKIGTDGITGQENVEFIDTGSYIINALLSASIYKGVPNNMITVLSGNESVGKTFIALNIAKNFQDHYENGSVFYFETENAIMEQMLIDRGFDLDRWVHIQSTTVEQFRTGCVKVLNGCKNSSIIKPIIILDSLGNLSTNKEIADITDGVDKRDMTRAQLIKGAFRVLSSRLGTQGVPMIVTNHVYETMGLYTKKEQSGGSGIKYGAHCILEISKAKEKDSDKNIIGSILTFKNSKSRLTRENCVVKTRLFYETGLDRYYGLLDLGASGGLFKKVGNKWEMPDGTKSFENAIYKDPEKYFTKEILNKLDEIAQDVFNYNSTKELLVIDEELSEI